MKQPWHRISWSMRLLLLSLLCAPLLAEPAGTGREVETYAGFLLTTGWCAPNDGPCSQQGPKSWSPGERQKAKQAIDEIKARRSGEEVIQRVLRSRPIAIRRFTQGRRGAIVDSTIVASMRRNRALDVIELHDRFFVYGDSRDVMSGRRGYRYQTQVLLHELLHALDEHSDHEAFQTAVGFLRAGSRVRFSVNAPGEAAALQQWEAVIPRLERTKSYLEQRRLNRRLPMTLRPIRIPTMDTMRSPAEAFAEIGSHLILDENASKYLPRRVTDYFAAHVGIPIADGELGAVTKRK